MDVVDYRIPDFPTTLPILKSASSAGKRVVFFFTKIKANTGYCEYTFVARNLKNINWEHVVFDEGKFRFLLFL